MFYRDTWAEIDLARVAANIRKIQACTGKAFFAVIKANGYGVGDVALAEAAVASGVAYLAVSSLEEALRLRRASITHPILVLAYMHGAALPAARDADVTVTASSAHWVKEALSADTKGLKVHLKVDTGMHRIGFTELPEMQAALTAMDEKGLAVEGIYTHFAGSDDPANAMCTHQLARFEAVLTALNRPFRYIHCGNTDAAVHFPERVSNAVRCGIGMLGVSSFSVGLQPALALYSRLVHIQRVPKGETVGYGGTYTTRDDEWIGTIPIGYADGWLRRHQGRTCVVEEQECPFVGRICMDQAMLHLPKEYPVGTQVELIGPAMPVERVAAELDTIPYEIFTTLNERIAKVYLHK